MEIVNNYKAFCLNWFSKDLQINELQKSSTPKLVDVEIKFKDPKTWPKIAPNSNSTPFLNMFDNEVRLRIENVVSFRIIDGKEINFFPENKNIKSQDIKAFLLGSVFAAVLIQRGYSVFHGNALEKSGKSIVCLGNSGIGKSTIAYSLLTNGWNLLSDDLVCIDENFNVLPGIPRIKLWIDAIETFKLNYKVLEPVRNGIKKYIWTPPEDKICLNPTKLSRVYIANKRKNLFENENSAISEISSEQNAMLALRNQIFRPRFVRGLKKESIYFSRISNVIKSLPIYRMNLPDDIKFMNSWLANNDLLNFS